MNIISCALLQKKCMLCLSTSKAMYDIFGEAGNKYKIYKVISQHLWFGEECCKDKIICVKCWLKIDDFNKFYCEIESIHNDNVQSQSALDIKSEDAIENIESEEDIPMDEETHVEDTRTSDFEESDNEPLITKKTKDKQNRRMKKEQMEQYECEEQQIREFCKMKCELCSEVFERFNEVKNHYKSIHNQKGYIECCGRRYVERRKIAEHIMIHINPKAFNCDLCNKNYSNLRTLNSHKIMTHGPEELRPFKCDKCPRSYVKKHLLNQHQVHHIPDEDKKFICPQCDKAFPTRGILQQHIRGTHEGANVLICDICSKVLKSKQNFKMHREEHFISKKIQCTICGVWLKGYSVKKHMKRHEEEHMEFVCDLCGKQSPNRHALHKHKNDVHIMERNFKCNLCEKAFKREISLREHIATHTGKQLYSCLYCDKTFNSSANMHSHKKKMHRAEWEETRRLKSLP